MNVDFRLPSLGENIESGDVVNVLVREGDQIEGNRGIIELETEKAVVEIPCPHAGKIVKLHVKKGDRIKVGQTLVTVETEEKAETSEPGRVSPEGSRVQGSEVRVQGSGGKEPAGEAAPRHPVTPSPPHPVTPSPSHLLPAGPTSRRLARELGVDLGAVAGSGVRGRITPEDVQSAARGVEPGRVGPKQAPSETTLPPGEPANDSWGPVRRERMSQIRRTIAAQMSRSASTIPHVTNFDDADVTDLEQLRKGLPQGFFGANLKLTLMPLVMKAVALALGRHPVLNASLDDQKEEIVYKQYVNLGVAVDTPRGLVVPAVRNADRLSIAQLARAVAELAEKARTAKFAIEELRGGTFTISNLGAVGGTYSTPIINHPEVAILLLGRSRWLPVVRDGKIEPRLMLPLSLSYDHRLVDGAAAGRFLNEVINLLQSPGKMLLEDGGR